MRKRFPTLTALTAIVCRSARGNRNECAVSVCSKGIADEVEGRDRLAVFREGLRALGWFEGKNIEFSYRWELRQRGDRTVATVHLSTGTATTRAGFTHLTKDTLVVNAAALIIMLS